MFYVYSNVIEPTLVGDTKTQLLRVFTSEFYENNRNLPVVLNREFVSPHFKPVKRGLRSLTDIELLITDEMGRGVQFTKGKTMATLEFSRE